MMRAMSSMQDCQSTGTTAWQQQHAYIWGGRIPLTEASRLHNATLENDHDDEKEDVENRANESKHSSAVVSTTVVLGPFGFCRQSSSNHVALKLEMHTKHCTCTSSSQATGTGIRSAHTHSSPARCSQCQRSQSSQGRRAGTKRP